MKPVDRDFPMPHLSQIFIYPIKSLDGVAVSEIRVLESGALAHDREFALVDSQGKFVNGKRTATIQRLRSQFDLLNRTVTLTVQGQTESATFHLDADRPALENWLSRYFGFPIQVQQNVRTGFPDDTEANGPTVISVATLKTIAQWFPGLTWEQLRLRLRTNLEIDGVPAFWEDRWFGKAGQTIPFGIGAIQFLGINPCQRCIVPTRDGLTGEPYPQFQKQFAAQRQATLPEWVEPSRFNHFYRVALNTRIPTTEAGKVLRTGDSITEG